MRILFLTETIPFPLDSGGRIKTYQTLQMLAREHEVHCHAFIRKETQRALASQLAFCASVTVSLVKRSAVREAGHLARAWMKAAPYSVERHFDRTTLEQIRSLCRRTGFAAVYCDHLSMMEYAKRLSLPIIHDAHNVEFDLLRRYAAALGASPQRVVVELEWRLVRAYERRAYRASDLVLAVSEDDARRIRALAETPRIQVLPIPLDIANLPFNHPLPSDPNLLFVGGLHWPPNANAMEFFARDIWPLVRRGVPAARLTVAGRDDARCSSRLRGIDGITLTGYVEDIEPFFQRSRVLVVPVRAAGGMRVKILDALARGLPVVTTPIGCEGIAATTGTHLLCAEDARAFADATIRVLNDPELAGMLAAAGRQLVCDHYSVSAIQPALLEAIRSLPRSAPTADSQPDGD